MKTSKFVVALLAAGVEFTYADEIQVTERGPDYKIVQSVTTDNLTNHYTELATGMNYTNASGQWTESLEQIVITPMGGEAVQGQHKVYFPGNIYNRFVYDGWNLLATINPSSSIQQSFMWGNDLSGTEDQAGGIGGLLMASITGTNCFVTYDGNGNITGLINAADKSLAARYEYSPYGELLRETGLLSRQNPFRFSTKYWDDESGLVYYGDRYYSPALGRWISKDPSEENGGINLFLFVANSPQEKIDTLGDSPKGTLGSIFLSIVISLGGAKLDANGIPIQLGRNPLSESTRPELEIEAIENSEKYKQLKEANRIKGSVGGIATIAVTLGLVALDTTAEAGVAAADVLSGGHSTDPTQADLEGFFRNINSDSAESDLDATIAALQLGGYQADAATVAWGTLQSLGEVYEEIQ